MSDVAVVKAAIIINEICTDPQTDWSGGNWVIDGGGSITGSDEYIELYNTGPESVDVAYWIIECIDSKRDTHVIDTLLLKNTLIRGTVLAPDSFAVLGNMRGDMNNSVYVALYSDSGICVDCVSLGTYDDGDIADNGVDGNALTGVGLSVGRDRFFQDTDTDFSDLLTMSPTPGAHNSINTQAVLIVNEDHYTGFSGSVTVSLLDRDRDTSRSKDVCGVAVEALVSGSMYTLNLEEQNMHGGIFRNELFFSSMVNSGFALGVDPDGDTVLITVYDDVHGDTAITRLIWEPAVDSGFIIINEIMANAAGSESDNEWFELYNAGDDTVRLRGWSLAVGATIIAMPQTLILPPKEYGVVVRQLVDLDEDGESFEISWGNGDGVWGNDPMESFVVVKASFPTLVNTHGVMVLSNNETCYDTVQWVSDAGNGVSWERHEAIAPTLEKSISSVGSTPGHLNSVTPFIRDCALIHGSVKLTVYDSVSSTITVKIRNEGIESMGTLVHFYVVGSETSLITTTSTGILQVGDSLAVTVPWDTVVTATYSLLIIIDADDDPRDDSLFAIVSLEGKVVNSVVINEIMFAPLSDEEPEWIELYNTSVRAVDISGWSCGDAGAGFTLRTGGHIAGYGYALITADSTFFVSVYPDVTAPVLQPTSWNSLKNSDDVIMIRDQFGRTITAVTYIDSWMGDRAGDKGISLERVDPLQDAYDPSNWWACTKETGATPGALNSVAVLSIRGPAEVWALPDPFSPDSDGFDDRTRITVRVERRSYITVVIYDVRGRLLKTLYDDVPCMGVRSLEWDGTDDRNTQLSIGMYIVYLEARDAASEKVTRRKATIVLARKLN